MKIERQKRAKKWMMRYKLVHHYEEPLKEGYKLAELDNVILTPHIGGLSYEAFHQMMAEAVANIVAFEEGRLDEIESKRIL